MADPRAIVQVSLRRKAAIGADIVVNTMHFEADIEPLADARQKWDETAPGLVNRVEAFYDAISPHLASTLTGEIQIKVYDFADAKPRVPRIDEVRTIVPASTALPAEVAITMSMLATPKSGVKSSSRRGRIFLGPLATNTLEQVAGASDVTISGTARTAIANAGHALRTGTAGGSFRLAVFSQTLVTRGTPMDDAWSDIASVYVDNTFDVQRRRGTRPTVRTVGA